MNPITHLLTGFALGETSGLERRDRALVAWSAVVPDLDGFGMVVDGANRLLGREETFVYLIWHHRFGHGLPAALVAAGLAAAVARNRVRTALFVFIGLHLHLAGDLVGSRGPTPDDVWPIHYLAPLSERLTVAWSGQWALNAWPNIALTLVLLAWAFAHAVRTGRSPVALFNERAHRAVVATLCWRWARMRGRGPDGQQGSAASPR